MIAVLVTAATLLTAAAAGDDDLRTVAESSQYRATATHAQVMDLLQRIKERSRVMRLLELGRTFEGRPIPLVVLADPPLQSSNDAHARGRPIVFAFGDIHAGEVCGKEALLRLVREIALAPHHRLLRDLVILVAPILNGDGNDRMSADHRPGQVGPAEGMGQRPNAQGLDLNRDWIKLETPEVRAVVGLLSTWDPDLTIDTHTTDGSRHRYVLTYAAPLNPSGHGPSIAFVREELLPAVSARLREREGYDTFFYGNFNRPHTVWATYSANPRFGGPYRGLRGQMSILSEAYAYASYEERVLATGAFVREILTYLAEHAGPVHELYERARLETIAAGRHPQPSDLVGLRHRPAAFPEPAVIHGYALVEQPDGSRGPGPIPADHTVVNLGRFEATLAVPRPRGYLFDARAMPQVAEKLRQHGVFTMPAPPGLYRLETYTVTAVHRGPRPFQNHRLLRLEVTASARSRAVRPGTLTLVPTAQPLGTLAVYLLEPQSADGLVAWNFLDPLLRAGQAYPIERVVETPPAPRRPGRQ